MRISSYNLQYPSMMLLTPFSTTWIETAMLNSVFSPAALRIGPQLSWALLLQFFFSSSRWEAVVDERLERTFEIEVFVSDMIDTKAANERWQREHRPIWNWLRQTCPRAHPEHQSLPQSFDSVYGLEDFGTSQLDAWSCKLLVLGKFPGAYQENKQGDPIGARRLIKQAEFL